MRQTAEGSWAGTTEQVDWNKIDATSDAEIERQVGGVVAQAVRLHVSPSSVRRWRQARVMPSLAHRQRLHHLLKAQ
jgi:DNA-binding transcriptional regulator YiaG